MDVSKIVAEIDAKIASLHQARAVLVDLDETSVAAKPRRGRPKGSTSVAKTVAAKPKRNLTPEGRKRIADAMKRRWAARRKESSSAAKKIAAKKEPAKK
jgi:predicted HAD superfamily phosphohydrolase YqeG